MRPKTSRALSYTSCNRRVIAGFRPTPSAHVVQIANVLDPLGVLVFQRGVVGNTDGGSSS